MCHFYNLLKNCRSPVLLAMVLFDQQLLKAYILSEKCTEITVTRVIVYSKIYVCCILSLPVYFMIGKHWVDFSFLSRYGTESDMEYFCAQASQEHDNFQNSKLEIILVLQTLPRDSFSLSVKKGLFNLRHLIVREGCGNNNC